MRANEIVKFQKQIHRYLHGSLDQKQVDSLWINLLKNPNWLEILEIELLFISFIRNNKKRILK
jgi:hypothetical protein